MKVAIVHDYIKEYGGAEKVLENLYEIFPDSVIHTLVYCPKFLGPHRKRFEKFKIRTSFLQYFPFREKFISFFRVVSPFVFKSFDLSGFDLIIVSQTGAYFPNLVNKNDKKLICYTHTPPRYLYGYKTARQWKKNIVFRILGEIANHFLRVVDFYASKNVDYFIANSKEVQARIKKFYRRDSVVIYPPCVKNSKPKTKTQKLNYYLTGGRLARAKGTDIVVDAFIKNGMNLKVFGRGFAGFESELRSKLNYSENKNSNIEFLGEVSEEEKFELMKNANAFIFASYDEDFGITPVEAMSVGTPIIAYRSGGVRETVIDKVTGVFYNHNDPDELNRAIKAFENMKFDPKDCVKQAKKFSKEKFEIEIRKLVNPGK